MRHADVSKRTVTAWKAPNEQRTAGQQGGTATAVLRLWRQAARRLPAAAALLCCTPAARRAQALGQSAGRCRCFGAARQAVRQQRRRGWASWHQLQTRWRLLPCRLVAAPQVSCLAALAPACCLPGAPRPQQPAAPHPRPASSLAARGGAMLGSGAAPAAARGLSRCSPPDAGPPAAVAGTGVAHIVCSGRNSTGSQATCTQFSLCASPSRSQARCSSHLPLAGCTALASPCLPLPCCPASAPAVVAVRVPGCGTPGRPQPCQAATGWSSRRAWATHQGLHTA